MFHLELVKFRQHSPRTLYTATLFESTIKVGSSPAGRETTRAQKRESVKVAAARKHDAHMHAHTLFYYGPTSDLWKRSALATV